METEPAAPVSAPDPTPAIEAATAASTPPIGISSRMIFIVVLLAIAGFAAVSAFILFYSHDKTMIASVEKSWDWAFAMAIGFILGSSAGSRNKETKP